MEYNGTGTCIIIRRLLIGVKDPHPFHADPDPEFEKIEGVGPDPYPALFQIRN